MICPNCRSRDAEVLRLRRIIADQDQRIIRDSQRRAAADEQLTYHLDRLRKSQELLANELKASRP